MIGPLHKLASVLLSAGLAVQTARFIAAHPTDFQYVVTRSVWGMLLLILSLTALVSGSRLLSERRAISQLAPPPAGAPNVLFITLDTVRARSLSLYGYGRETSPQLERLAKRGVVFERALATAPWTLPSHASMFTGRFPHELRADWNVPLDNRHPTLAEAFSAQGYLTAGFAANTLYCSYEHGLDRGFAHYEDYSRSPGQIILSSSLGRFLRNRLLPPYIEEVQIIGLKTAAELNRDFLHWVSSAGERPFFVFLNYFDAHAPYMPPAPFETRFGPKRARPETVLQEWSQQEAQVVIDAYDGSIAYIDHQLGLLFDQLERRGLMENTLVIVTSDHGEQFGEHGLYDHANSLYRPLLEVPLVISFPARVPAAKRIQEPVTLADLPSTVVELAALQHAPRFPGNSLTRHWEEGTIHAAETPLLMLVSRGINNPEWWPVSKGDMKSLLADGLYYIRNGDGREELYDFENDVLEERDLAGTAEGQRALERFRKDLDVLFKR
jgi:arylsulfatase A-like enzyme